MEKRVLLAVVLSFAVLYVYQAVFVPPRPAAPVASGTSPGPSGGGSGSTANAPPASEAAAASAAVPMPSSVAPAAAPATADATAAGSSPILADAADREVIVESETIRAVFRTQGARLTSWTLKKYAAANGQPVELVAPPDSAAVPAAFAVTVDDAQVSGRLRDALYKPSHDRLTLGTGGDSRLIFEYQDADGLSARKEFAFGDAEHPYRLAVTASVVKDGSGLKPTIHSGPGLGDAAAVPASSSFFAPSYSQPTEALFYRDGSVTRLPVAELATESAFQGQFGYVGIDDHYFLQVLLPGQTPVAVQYAAVGPDGVSKHIAFASAFPASPAEAVYFFGPKHFDTLAATETQLVRAINFGMFDVIVVPLLRALNWVNGFVGNYGWSIIILTILINAAMFPLRHKSVVSMRKLQQIQPEIQAIQARYANLKATDPQKQKMNQEMMALYREKGVNPAGGCVPMLLTLPVLFAFYSMLQYSIELRGAPFMGWISDLSKFDPSYVTPILMGATMLWQQKITPSTADPVQQRVMLFMPVMFTFMFLWAPSGLVLYWFVSNLWTIGQQYITNALIGPAPTPAPKAAIRASK